MQKAKVTIMYLVICIVFYTKILTFGYMVTFYITEKCNRGMSQSNKK